MIKQIRVTLVVTLFVFIPTNATPFGICTRNSGEKVLHNSCIGRAIAHCGLCMRNAQYESDQTKSVNCNIFICFVSKRCTQLMTLIASVQRR